MTWSSISAPGWGVAQTRERLRCSDVELIAGAVLEYDIPDDLTIVYLNGPFTGPVFEATVAKLMASYQRNPRLLRVIYANPNEERALLDAGFRQVRALRGMRPSADWSRSNSARMYALTPTGQMAERKRP